MSRGAVWGIYINSATRKNGSAPDHDGNSSETFRSVDPSTRTTRLDPKKMAADGRVIARHTVPLLIFKAAELADKAIRALGY